MAEGLEQLQNDWLIFGQDLICFDVVAEILAEVFSVHVLAVRENDVLEELVQSLDCVLGEFLLLDVDE